MSPQSLAKFGVTEDDFLGHGGESRTYLMPDGRMLRVYKEAGDKRSFLEMLQAFYDGIDGKFSFKTPLITEIGEDEGLLYTINRFVPGRALSEVLPKLNAEEKQRTLQNYFEAMLEISRVSFPDRPYGQILSLVPATANTWPEFLRAMLRRRVTEYGAELRKDVAHFDQIVALLYERAGSFETSPEKKLVHGDYFPSNVVVGDDLSISGVIDFSEHTFVGDPLLDVCTCYVFLEAPVGYDPGDLPVLLPMIVAKYGEKILPMIEYFRAYYAIYFGEKGGVNAEAYPEQYAYSIRVLNEFSEKNL